MPVSSWDRRIRLGSTQKTSEQGSHVSGTREAKSSSLTHHTGSTALTKFTKVTTVSTASAPPATPQHSVIGDDVEIVAGSLLDEDDEPERLAAHALTSLRKSNSMRTTTTASTVEYFNDNQWSLLFLTTL